MPLHHSRKNIWLLAVLIHLIRPGKDPVPVDTVPDITIPGGEPDEERLAYDVILGHKPPNAGIF